MKSPYRNEKSFDFDESCYTSADLELNDSHVTKYIYIYIYFFNSRWRMDAILKIVFGHNSAADIMISVKFCVKKQFFHRISVMGQILQFYRTDFFCFPNAVWASAISAFRIVSDTFVVKVYGNILASYIRQRRRLCFRPCLRVCVC